MTAILGIVHEGRAYLISDSYLGDDDYSTFDLVGEPKIMKVGRSTYLATAGEADETALYIELIQTALKGVKTKDRAFFTRRFPLICRSLAKEAALDFPLEDASFLLMRPGALYYLGSNMSCHPVAEEEPVGLGIGRDMARAAYRGLTWSGYPSPEEALPIAMEITEMDCPYVCGPFHLEVL